MAEVEKTNAGNRDSLPGKAFFGHRKETILEKMTNEKYFRWTLLIPLILVLLIFMLYPLIYCIYYSFHEWGMTGDPIFIGLQNYREMFRDESFLKALGRTFQVTLICIIMELSIGLGLALLWNREFRGQSIVRGLTLLPLLIAPLVLSLLWNFLLEYDFCALNMVLESIWFKKFFVVFFLIT